MAAIFLIGFANELLKKYVMTNPSSATAENTNKKNLMDVTIVESTLDIGLRIITTKPLSRNPTIS